MISFPRTIPAKTPIIPRIRPTKVVASTLPVNKATDATVSPEKAVPTDVQRDTILASLQLERSPSGSVVYPF